MSYKTYEANSFPKSKGSKASRKRAKSLKQDKSKAQRLANKKITSLIKKGEVDRALNVPTSHKKGWYY